MMVKNSFEKCIKIDCNFEKVVKEGSGSDTNFLLIAVHSHPGTPGNAA